MTTEELKYLHKLGFKKANNDIFAKHSWYFRNALVRANYEDLSKGIHKTNIFLVRFLENALLGANNELKNRTMHIKFTERDLQIHRNDAINQDVGKNQEKLGIRLGANDIEIIELINRKQNEI
jgi:hypothetical protein